MNKLFYIALLSSVIYSQNAPPVLITIGDQIIDEDTQIYITLSAYDPDGDILTFTAGADNEYIAVSLSSNILTLLPSENYYGVALVTVTVSDGFLTDSETFTLTVIPVNDAPVLLPIDDQIIYGSTQIDITISGYDVDGDELVFSAATDTEDITVSVNGSVLILTPAEYFIGSAMISVTANDGATGSNMETFILTVLPVNDLSTWHVSITGSDENGDGSEENPFATIQHGIEVANDGDTVLVFPGIFYGPIDFLGKSIVLGSLYLLEENEFYIEETILSNFVNISLLLDSELNGFTFQDIYLNSENGPQAIIYIEDASPIIINNRFDNFYLFQGVESAVIYCENSNSLIMNNVFTNGSVGNGYVLGGYILSKNSNLTIKNNRIENGYVGFAEPSGYIVSVNSENIIESNIIINSSMGYCWVCAAISVLEGSDCIIRNNLILQVSGDGYGAVVASGSQYLSKNNTFVSNSVGYANLSSDGTVSNDIIYGTSNPVYIDEYSSIEISYSDVEGGWEGIGNIDSDPLFVAPDNGDFTLQEGSPCIDAGDPDSPLDPDGTIADMGAYYYYQGGSLPTEIIIDLQLGWNLLGLPLDVEDVSYNLLFPESIEGTLYSFDNGYNLETSLIHGEGYWLRFNEAGSSTITGGFIAELTITLSEGWNLISGISAPLEINEIEDPDGIIIIGTVYGFSSGGYLNTEDMEPGKGYWIRANSSGTIFIQN